jgi:hypothetical protein
LPSFMILLPRDETDRNERDAEQINQRIALACTAVIERSLLICTCR